MSVHQQFESASFRHGEFQNALIPDHAEFFGAVVSALPDNRRKAYRILDLSAGTGTLSCLVAKAYPHASLIVSDPSRAMLDAVRAKLGHQRRCEFVQLDMLMDPLPQDLDIVVSSMALHRLDHADKRYVFSRVCQALKPGGMFVNADKASSGEEHTDQRLFDHWLADVRASGMCEKDLKPVIEIMQSEDRNAPQDLQLKWLRQSGFEHAELTYWNYFWAVFRAIK